MSDRNRLITVPAVREPLRWRRELAQVRWTARPGFLVSFATCFVLTFGLVWAYVVSMPMAFLDRDYPLWMAKRSMLAECRPDVAVFGDSRAVAGVMPKVMSIPVTNFAMSGTSPIETYFAVERLLRCRTPPRLVVIAHAALKYTGDPDYWTFSARSGFLTFPDMRSVDGQAARLNDTELEALRRGDQLPLVLRDLLFAWHFPAFYFDSLVHGWIAGRWLHNRRALADCLAASGHALFGRAAGSSGVTGEGDATGFVASPLVDFYFSRTLALLAQRKIPVVLAAMPINQASFGHITPGLRDGFENYMRIKTGQFPSVQVATPALSCWPDRYFGDAWHFNAEGSAAFSRELGAWLQERLAGRMPPPIAGRCVPIQEVSTDRPRPNG